MGGKKRAEEATKNGKRYLRRSILSECGVTHTMRFDKERRPARLGGHCRSYQMATVIIGPLGSDSENLATYLRGENHEVITAVDMSKVLDNISKRAVDVAVVEIDRGMRLVQRLLDLIQTDSPPTLVIGVTEEIDDKLAKGNITQQIFDIIKKPVQPAELLVRVRKAIDMKRLWNETQNLRGERKIIYRAEELVAESPAMSAVLDMAKRVAPTDSTVLLSGETGTGKEMVAAVLHYNSARAKQAFVRVNCAALPETLLETELFGHERGAFTGASSERIGRFEQADGGTMLLDEVGELSGGTQAKLLRVLQEGQFERVGGGKTLSVNVRLISSTNRDLPADVADGRFREDLFYRLNVVPIHLPPLRERQQDILPLAQRLLARHAREMHQTRIQLSADAESALLNHDWPGNIRELENVIERALIMTDSEVISSGDLELRRMRYAEKTARQRMGPETLSDGLHDVERDTILEALEASDWVQKKAAEMLQVSPRSLNYKIRKLGIRHGRWRRNR